MIKFNFDLFNNNYFFYERLVVILFSLVPALILVGIVLYTDRKSREPVKNILLCLLSGFLTIALSQYLETFVLPYFSNNVVLTYVWAFIEELSKILIFYLFIFDNKYYDDIYDGLVYMTLIALSFAGLENIMYAFSESTLTNSISLAIMRDITTIPLHVICGIIIGYFISLGSFSRKKNKKYLNFSFAILISSVVHGTFNLFMSILGNISIDYNNTLSVFVFQLIPIILIMVILIFIATKFTFKCLNLHNIYINNGIFDKKHDYLMNKNEYLNSYKHHARLKMYKKTNFIKREGS